MDLKKFVAANYMTQIKNFFGNEKQAMKFLSSMMSSVQRLPALIDCEPLSLINAFMTMAQLGLMPSDVSGEAYVLPYNQSGGEKKAQFQLGYQGLVTLFYRAGGQRIRAEIVREHDQFSYVNGEVKHTVDITKSKKDRGEAIAAYAIATIGDREIANAMNSKDILDFGRKFSKSFASKFTPWNETNDPELWMWKKTVLKQLGKLLPKNETINKALEEDNQDSVISDRLNAATKESKSLTMGAALKIETEEKPKEEAKNEEPADEE